ncbi:MAG: hypothetical protein ACO1NZ_12365 [Adhaeribacter sp.]
MDHRSVKTKHGFWEFKRYHEYEWFRFLVYLMTAIGLAYIVSHLLMARFHEKAGYEYEKLDARQLQHLNTIYFDSLQADLDALTPGLDRLRLMPDSLRTRENKRLLAQQKAISDSIKCARVLMYLQHEFNGKVDQDQLNDMRAYLCTARPLEAISFLSLVRLQVRSYFWLTGPEVYFEVIFWSWFGVICSILYNLGVVAKSITTVPNNPHTVFDSTEIPNQVAKMIYAPLCTMSIVLGYNYFSDRNIVDISSSKGLIVFAFIGGFYSSRLIAFLDRLKEVILPSHNTPELPAQRTSGQILLHDILVELTLQEGVLSAELTTEIAEIGFNDASVELENEETGDLVSAVPAGEDQTALFKVPSLRPGKYLIRASWSKEINGEPVNLEARQIEQVLSSEITIVVNLKKAAGEG